MPNPAKSGSLKAISGTARADRASNSEPCGDVLEELPAAPAWMTDVEALAEWDRLGRILIANELLDEASITSFAHLCALHGQLVAAYRAGKCPSGHVYNQFRSLVHEFGLTPASQSKVNFGGKAPNANPFDGVGFDRAA